MRWLITLIGCTLLAGDAHKAADLGWIAGAWQGKLGVASIDEVWTAPLDGNMTGMFRMMRSGRVGMYELMSIEDSANGPVLRLRHFNAKLDARDAKGERVCAGGAGAGQTREVSRQRRGRRGGDAGLPGGGKRLGG